MGRRDVVRLQSVMKASLHPVNSLFENAYLGDGFMSVTEISLESIVRMDPT